MAEEHGQSLGLNEEGVEGPLERVRWYLGRTGISWLEEKRLRGSGLFAAFLGHR